MSEFFRNNDLIFTSFFDLYLFIYFIITALSEVSSFQLYQPHLTIQCYSWAHRWVNISFIFIEACQFSVIMTKYVFNIRIKVIKY